MKSYLVGERGPEIFTPQSSGYITANRNIALAPAGGGSSGGQGTTIVHYHVNIGTVKANKPEDFMRQMQAKVPRMGQQESRAEERYRREH